MNKRYVFYFTDKQARCVLDALWVAGYQDNELLKDEMNYAKRVWASFLRQMHKLGLYKVGK